MNLPVQFYNLFIFRGYKLVLFILLVIFLLPVCAETVKSEDPVTLFLTGDVMTGRGIDQVLPYSADPQLHEPYMRDARGYVELAEKRNGPIGKPVSCTWLWGDALGVLDEVLPDVRIINLETSITTSDDYWQHKDIHYRMHPGNVACLREAGIDYCSLANNHVLDWGYAGLAETLVTLGKADIRFAGAGQNQKQAEAPAILKVPGKGRVIVFSYGLMSSGIMPDWVAREDRPGVNFLADLSYKSVQRIKSRVEEIKQDGDIVVVSLHWGDNWGYSIPKEQVNFARKLIDEAQVDLIHGHSSHHPRGMEIYKGRLVLYGAGDFLNDYEGIGGYEEFRGDLSLMYFVNIDPLSGKTIRLKMVPMQIRQFSLRHASREDAMWIREMLTMASERFGTRFEINKKNILSLRLNGE